MITGMALVLGLSTLAALFLWLNRPRLIRIEAPIPDDFPKQGFPHDLLQQLLHAYVDRHGHVDYGSWSNNPADRERLERYLAGVARYSPENSPQRFASRAEELAYWLNAYNAYVIKAVLQHWPISSVTAVRAPIEIVKGLGFFYRLRFEFGGRPLSLYAVENNIIRPTYRDPRIHFVLNCGSEGCPMLRPELPQGNDVERILQEAAAEFVADRKNVCVDHDARRVRLSAIFKWYKSDFINELRRRGQPAAGGLLAYIASIAPAPLAAELASARDYRLEFSDYDWSLNSS